VLARSKEEQASQCESLQAKLQAAEESIHKLKETLSSKDAAIDEMKEHLEIPLRKVIESLSCKLLLSRLLNSSTPFECLITFPFTLNSYHWDGRDAARTRAWRPTGAGRCLC
jgi:hypothetical protein